MEGLIEAFVQYKVKGEGEGAFQVEVGTLALHLSGKTWKV